MEKKQKIHKIFPRLLTLLLLLALLVSLTACFANQFEEGVNQDTRKMKPHSDERMYGDAPGYDAFVYKLGKDVMTYRLKSPAKAAEGAVYPLIVFLHGSGDWGTDNRSQVYRSLVTALETNAKEDYFVFMPQTAKKHNWTADGDSKIYNACLDQLLKDHPIDQTRIYLTGMSMGGAGTFYQLKERPNLYAAGMPLCGYVPYDDLSPIKDIPIWLGHCQDDDVVKFSNSLDAYNTLVSLGVKVEKTWFNNIGHQVTQAFYQQPTVWTWLFAQQKERS